MPNNHRPLRLNVGFMLSQTAGYVRALDFAEDQLRVAEDQCANEFRGRIRLGRTPQGILVQGAFFAKTPAQCVRCLKPLSLDLRIDLQDLFLYPPPNPADPLLAVGEDGILDLEPLVREYLILDQPLRPLCSPDCRGLCPVCGNDLNSSECGHESQARLLGAEGISGTVR